MSVVTETFLTFQSGWVLSELTEGWDAKGKPPSLSRPGVLRRRQPGVCGAPVWPRCFLGTRDLPAGGLGTPVSLHTVADVGRHLPLL